MTNTEKDTAMQDLKSAVEAANMAGHKVRWAAIAAREAGATWAQIGEAEGITKQRAQQKYADSVTPEAIANRARLATLTTDELLAESKRYRESIEKARAEREARWAAEDAALAAPAAELADDDGQTPATASIFSDVPAPAVMFPSVPGFTIPEGEPGPESRVWCDCCRSNIGKEANKGTRKGTPDLIAAFREEHAPEANGNCKVWNERGLTMPYYDENGAPWAPGWTSVK